MTNEDEFRPLSYFDRDEQVYKHYTHLEVNRAGQIRVTDTGEILHDLACPEGIDMAFPDMVVDEKWGLIENGKYEISERGAIRTSDTKELKRSREGSQHPMIQSYLDDVFPDRNKKE